MKKRWLAVSFTVLSAVVLTTHVNAQTNLFEMPSPGFTAQQPGATPTPTPIPESTPAPPGAQPALPGAAQVPGPTPTPSPSATKSSIPTTVTAASGTVGNAAEPVCLCVKGKLKYAGLQTFRPGIYPVAAVYTAYTMVNPPNAYPPEWRQGFHGFARNYGDFMGSWASVQGAKFVVAAALREDPRYFPSKSTNIFVRTFNAARFAVIDRGDMGGPRPALANLAGAFAGGFVGNAYLPDPYADSSHGLSRSGFALLGFFTSNLADEFHPEIRKIATKLHLPFIGK